MICSTLRVNIYINTTEKSLDFFGPSKDERVISHHKPQNSLIFWFSSPLVFFTLKFSLLFLDFLSPPWLLLPKLAYSSRNSSEVVNRIHSFPIYLIGSTKFNSRVSIFYFVRFYWLLMISEFFFLQISVRILLMDSRPVWLMKITYSNGVLPLLDHLIRYSECFILYLC